MVLAVLLLLAPLEALAMGAAAPAQAPSGVPTDGKRVLLLDPVVNVSIQLPDGSWHDFGDDLRSMLVTQLTSSGGFIVAEDSPHAPAVESKAAVTAVPSPSPPPAYSW